MVLKKCVKCGALVEVLNDCTCENCGIDCCGEKMIEIVPNSVDASFEKHMPVVELVGDEVIVKVPHVMEEKHFIEWVALESVNGVQKKILEVGKDAVAKFPYIKGGKVYSYCNLHGLWSADVK